VSRLQIQIILRGGTGLRYKEPKIMAICPHNVRISSASATLRMSWLMALAVVLASCGQAPPTPARDYTVVNTYPHDRAAFTEGLFYLNGFLYESTGQYGQSSLRKVELKTGKVLQKRDIPGEFFGEGMAQLGGKLYQLTWRNQTGFVYDLNTFEPERQFFYPYEGWGLTTDGRSLILSDGSDKIRFIEPLTFSVQRTINVKENGRPLPDLNELEYIKGEIYANIWKTDRIVRIDPTTGQVLGDYDLSGLLPEQYRANTDVLNGIAYDPDGDHLYVTGKLWPKLFEIKLKP
jgi:glutamine cyclotransferase